MRTFVALDIDDAIRGELERFVDSIRALAPQARWVKSESLHVTLKFIGEITSSQVEDIKAALAAIDEPSFQVAFRTYGFFPNLREARVFWVGIQAEPALAHLAASIDQSLSPLAIPSETHPFRPHLTLARAGGRSGSPRRSRNDSLSQIFRTLHDRLSSAPVPGFGSMTAREFFLYQSQLSPKGSKYTKIARVGLR